MCLLQVVPVSGPLEGGVLVTIIGTNLGMRYQDVLSGVKVAGVQCLVQSEGYQISTRWPTVQKCPHEDMTAVRHKR